MPSFDSAKESICSMLESNNYRVRNGKMPGDDFRLFITPPGFEVESEEIFKLKGNDSVCCGAEIMMGGEMRGAFFKQSRKDRDNLREKIESATGVEGLDFFEIEDDGKDFRVSIRAEFPISKLSEDTFADAMDRLNLAGRSVEDMWNEYFENLIGS
jgi:hypothetical protein